jgi:hypothetical protein
MRRALCWLGLCPLQWEVFGPPDKGPFGYFFVGRCPHCCRSVAERPDGSRVP